MAEDGHCGGGSKRFEGRLLQTAISRVNHAAVQEQIPNGRPDWYLDLALRCLQIASGQIEAEPPFCVVCGVPSIASPVKRVLGRGRKGGDVSSFICTDCYNQRVDGEEIDEQGNRTLDTFVTATDGGNARSLDTESEQGGNR